MSAATVTVVTAVPTANPQAVQQRVRDAESLLSPTFIAWRNFAKSKLEKDFPDPLQYNEPDDVKIWLKRLKGDSLVAATRAVQNLHYDRKSFPSSGTAALRRARLEKFYENPVEILQQQAALRAAATEVRSPPKRARESSRAAAKRTAKANKAATSKQGSKGTKSRKDDAGEKGDEGDSNTEGVDDGNDDGGIDNDNDGVDDDGNDDDTSASNNVATTVVAEVANGDDSRAARKRPRRGYTAAQQRAAAARASQAAEIASLVSALTACGHTIEDELQTKIRARLQDALSEALP